MGPDYCLVSKHSYSLADCAPTFHAKANIAPSPSPPPSLSIRPDLSRKVRHTNFWYREPVGCFGLNGLVGDWLPNKKSGSGREVELGLNIFLKYDGKLDISGRPKFPGAELLHGAHHAQVRSPPSSLRLLITPAAQLTGIALEKPSLVQILTKWSCSRCSLAQGFSFRSA